MAVNSKQNELWREIPGFDGKYCVSNTGKIKNKKTGLEKKSYINENGYCIIGFYDKAKKSNVNFRVHRLVADAFLSNPDLKRTVNHKDGNKQNNNVGNLEWATHKENLDHAREMGLIVVTEKQRKTASKNIMKNRLLAKPEKKCCLTDLCGHTMEFPSIRAAANWVGGVPSAITRCCQGKAKTYKGYVWRYV